MTRILALDPATVIGWSLYDTENPISAIQCGSITLEGKGAFEKVKSVRHLLPKLIREHQPDFIVFESPLSHIPQFKKSKTNMLGEEETSSTINAGTILQLNRISGAVQAIIEGFNIPCEEVRPMTWQTVIPKKIKGGTKDRVRQFCDMFNIIGKNADARDAAVIALWAAGRSQILKLEKMTGRAA
jgi:Holliday junction resolvasome RuvABC endonuclease subunit